MADRDLEPAPPTPIVDGEPAFGTYRGACEWTRLEARERGIGRFDQWLREKHWQWFCVADDRLAVGGAIVDAGPVGTVFCWLADRNRKAILADVSRVVPGPLLDLSETPTAGRIATRRLARDPLRIERVGESVRITGSAGEMALDLQLEAPPADAVTAICPVAGGHPAACNVTQKEVTTTARGTVTLGRKRHSFTDAVGLLDHTHGLLARTTSWRWAFGVGTVDGAPVGFNLVAGFNDGLENVVWLDGEPYAVGRVTHDSDPAVDADWRVTAVDGDVPVDLRLELEAERRDGTDVGLLASSYRQPLGTWSGRIGDRDLENVFGVAEDHRATW